MTSTYSCPHGHGPMQKRPLERQTYEQRFCGTWYDCPQCYASVLEPSPELTAQLDGMRQREEISAPKAAEYLTNLHGLETPLHRDTTSRAAKNGQVRGARMIGPARVATRAAWREWYENRRPAGRPRKNNAEEGSKMLVPTSSTDAWREFVEACGSEAPARTVEELKSMVYLLGLGYWVEGALEQVENATPEAWGRALAAMTETGWAWDPDVPDEAVVERYNVR